MMTQPEQSHAPSTQEETSATAKVVDTDVIEAAPSATHETVDPFLGDFAPAGAKSADADDAAPSEAKARAPGPPNVAGLPSAGETLAMLDAADNADASQSAPTMGPPVGAGDEEAAANAEALTPLGIQQLEEKVIDAMRTVHDPEIPVNIYELGLIYELNIDPQGRAVVEMTLTSPACPVAGILPGEVEQKVLSVDGVNVAKVELVWDPPWTPDMMSEAAQLQLGFF